MEPGCNIFFTWITDLCIVNSFTEFRMLSRHGTIGRKELAEKTQVCEKTPQKKKQQTQLFERHHGWAQTDIKARGATTVRRTRTYSQSEQDRLSQAIAWAHLLQVRPLLETQNQSFCRLCHVQSQLRLGWKMAH